MGIFSGLVKVGLAKKVIDEARKPENQRKIKEVVAIDLPRPRRSVRNSADAGRYIDHIWSLIRDEAAQAIVEETS